MNFTTRIRRNLKRTIAGWDTAIVERWLQTLASVLPTPPKPPEKKHAKKARPQTRRRRHA